MQKCYPRTCFSTIAFILLSGIVGCGGGEKMYPAAGKIVWSDGQPAVQLAGGMVSLYNINSKERKFNTMGEIQPDATFTLSSGNVGIGAPAGDYQVAIMPKLDPSARSATPPWVHKRFLDYRTSELKVTIEPKENTITLKLERSQ